MIGLKNWIEPATMKCLCVEFTFSIRILFRNVPYICNACLKSVRCHGLTNFLLYVSPPFVNLVLNDCCFVSLHKCHFCNSLIFNGHVYTSEFGRNVRRHS